MGFKKLPSNSQKLLKEIVDSENPVKLLNGMFDSATDEQEEELCGILRELKEEGFISIMWADNRPYHIIINNVARMYEGQLAEYEVSKKQIESKNITIGNKNKVVNSMIAGTVQGNCGKKKNSFYEKHPVICSILISLATGLVLLFSFWQQIVHFIEGLF